MFVGFVCREGRAAVTWHAFSSTFCMVLVYTKVPVWDKAASVPENAPKRSANQKDNKRINSQEGKQTRALLGEPPTYPYVCFEGNCRTCTTGAQLLSSLIVFVYHLVYMHKSLALVVRTLVTHVYVCTNL